MTKNHLKFDGQGRPLFGIIKSRRLHLHQYRNVAYKSDAPKEDEGSEEEKELLAKVTKTMGVEFEKRGLKDKASIAALIATELNGLPLDALRAYAEDKKKAEDAVKKMAGELEKIKQNSLLSGGAVQKRDFLREQLEKNFPQIETLMRTRGEDKRTEIKFNIRAAVMTTTNTIDEVENDVPVELLESFTIAEFVGKRRGEQYIYDIADRTVIASLEQYTTWLEEGDESGAFAIVDEGAVKPLVSYDLVRNFAKAKKIAGKYVVTEEFAKFRQNAYNIIRRLIMDKLVRDYNALLVIDLNAQAAGYIGTALDGTVDDPNDYDAIGAVAAQIEALNFIPDVLILNPQDAWRIRLAKDNDGRYLFPVVTENGQTIMLGLRVKKSTYQTVGFFTLGESGLFKIEEEPVTVRMGYGVTVTGSNPVTNVVSDFDNNQMRCIVETWFKDWIATNNLGSFVRASFATVKAALAP
jgi:HK97 family phage major capsid protein